jgi:hypothetical protein
MVQSLPSLTNLALRGIMIWFLTFYFVSAIPSSNVPVSSKLLIATLIVLMYIIIEYIVFTVIIPRGVCRVLCGNINYAAENDKYIRNALRRLKLQERAGPAVQPTQQPSISMAPPAQQQPSISMAPPAQQQPSISMAPPAQQQPSISMPPPQVSPIAIAPIATIAPTLSPIVSPPTQDATPKVGGGYYW